MQGDTGCEDGTMLFHPVGTGSTLGLHSKPCSSRYNDLMTTYLHSLAFCKLQPKSILLATATAHLPVELLGSGNGVSLAKQLSGKGVKWGDISAFQVLLDGVGNI